MRLYERPSMPPGRTNVPRDRHGALVQPPGKGGKAPYAWFVFEPEFHGDPEIRWFPLSNGSKD
jgi:hypothetical protein